MDQPDQPDQPSNLPASPADASAAAPTNQQIVEAVFDAESDQTLPLIEQIMAHFASPTPAPAVAETRQLLESLWNYFKAIDLIQRAGDFEAAVGNFENAASEFNRLGFPYLHDLSVGMQAYCTAVVELRRFNIGAALDYFSRTKDFLQRAGKFSDRFRMMIALMEPDTLFVAGVQALLNFDLANAKVLIDQAARSLEEAAKEFFGPNSQEYFTFMGQAQFQRAFYTYFLACIDFNTFAYDKLTSAPDLANYARQAQELLGKGDLKNSQVKILLILSEGFVQLIEAVHGMATLMQKVFASTVKVDLRSLKPIAEKIRVANECFSKGGTQAVSMVRFCDQLSDQVNNLERLARPDKKDFGKFAGIIACAFFLPIFLVVSWANEQFRIGLDGYKLLGTCFTLALIGGFGFGALRFKSIFSSFFSSKEKD